MDDTDRTKTGPGSGQALIQVLTLAWNAGKCEQGPEQPALPERVWRSARRFRPLKGEQAWYALGKPPGTPGTDLFP